MIKKIAIFTTTRAEFGIFIPLINALKADKQTDVLLFVGGTHLAKEHGFTNIEIKNNDFEISKTFDYLLNEDSAFSLAKSCGIETIELAHIFNDFYFDAICILGDRYELLPIVLNSILFKKAIIHIHGGEKTEGAIDEQIRHMITKSAHLHFAATDEYAKNIISIGEEKHRVFNTGALSVVNMCNVQKKSKNKLFSELNLDTEIPTVLMTYHPVTLNTDFDAEIQIKNIFAALKKYNFQLVITAPNIDADRNIISKIIDDNVSGNKNYIFFNSLGVVNYINLLKYSEFVIGNSSSGIIEVPFFKKPTVNIGCRQQGRMQHKSILNTDYSIPSIQKAIEIAISEKFKEQISDMEYKFGNEKTAQKMLEIIKNTNFNNEFLIKKLTFN
ncbi:MAG: UDP-N-acetylglucosamine 2-epimerase (hydrolyzing) [Bacteroidales bacterium]|nr:UDP-N-acetylglucosamine 2-epimerase (hydrolyzing) [Bacteroidales bacterium]